MRVEETDVVIVGGGVGGLLLAVESFRRGFRARLLDPRAGAPGGRCALLQPAALEVLSRLEIYDAVRMQGAPIERLLLMPAGSSVASVTLDLAEAGEPFPHALAVPEEALRAVCLDAFAKYRAVALEPSVEMLSLLRENGRVTGALAQGPQGDVTYRAKVIAVTTTIGGAPVRAEVGAATRSETFPEERAFFALPRPDDWDAEAVLWVGPGISVIAWPATARRLHVEMLAAGGILSGAKGGGTESMRRLIGPVAPRLEPMVASLRSADDVTISSATRSRVKTTVGEAVALTGPAAQAMSPWGLGVDTQSVLDQAVLAAVLSKCLFTGDVSRLALRAYETTRQAPREQVAQLSNDLHRAAVARTGLYARARTLGLERLAASATLQRKVVRTMAGRTDSPLTTGDRLRLAGLLPAE